MELAKPERGVPLATQLVDQIRQLIHTGEWAVGQRIPGEIELAASLGISRNSVREALRSLVHAGLLDSRPGDGTYVVAHSEIEAALRRQVHIERAHEVFEVRSLLEQRGARLAAQHATEADIRAMRQSLAARDAADTDGAFVAHDVVFHQKMVRSGKNALLSRLYDDLDALAAHVGSIVSKAHGPHRFRDENADLIDKHHELLAAIESRKPELAEAIAEEIVMEAEHRYSSENRGVQ
ncbi:MAG: FadR family transcriptional regulator [Comamonadaceae bacterium]|nr:MAG: FadR family transcriptional regulator [Comamonadaceae bacterium]